MMLIIFEHNDFVIDNHANCRNENNEFKNEIVEINYFELIEFQTDIFEIVSHEQNEKCNVLYNL